MELMDCWLAWRSFSLLIRDCRRWSRVRFGLPPKECRAEEYDRRGVGSAVVSMEESSSEGSALRGSVHLSIFSGTEKD